MKGKNEFSKFEIEKLKELISQKIKAKLNWYPNGIEETKHYETQLLTKYSNYVWNCMCIQTKRAL